jgi:hypothetical protein
MCDMQSYEGKYLNEVWVVAARMNVLGTRLHCKEHSNSTKYVIVLNVINAVEA